MIIKEYLFYNRMSVKDLAEKIGYSRSHVNMVLLGNKPISEKMAQKIAAFTGINEDDIFDSLTKIYYTRSQ